MSTQDILGRLRDALDDGQAPWPLAPIRPGPWRDLDADTEVRVLSRLAAEQAARAEDPIPFHHRVRRLRAMPLRFYRRTLLVEGMAEVSDAIGQPPATFAFVLGDRGAAVLSWSAEDLRALNARHALRLDGEDAFLDYLHLFTAVAGGPDGRFRIVATREELAAAGLAEAETVLDRAADLATPVRAGAAREGQRDFTACVLYRDGLFEAEFTVFATGEVAMRDDRLLIDDLPIPEERFMGPFRMRAHPG